MGGMGEIRFLVMRWNAARETSFRVSSLPFLKRGRVTLKGYAS
jgi:hypothetical protein